MHQSGTAHLEIAAMLSMVICCRYYGVNDPVARKMLNRVDTMPKLAPPEDASITTLYVGGLTPVITEDDIRDQFYSYGELQSVKKVFIPNTLSLQPYICTYVGCMSVQLHDWIAYMCCLVIGARMSR